MLKIIARFKLQGSSWLVQYSRPSHIQSWHTCFPG